MPVINKGKVRRRTETPSSSTSSKPETKNAPQSTSASESQELFSPGAGARRKSSLTIDPDAINTTDSPTGETFAARRLSVANPFARFAGGGGGRRNQSGSMSLAEDSVRGNVALLAPIEKGKTPSNVARRSLTGDAGVTPFARNAAPPATDGQLLTPTNSAAGQTPQAALQHQRRSIRDEFRFAVGQVIAMGRLDTEGKGMLGLEKSSPRGETPTRSFAPGNAPFGIATPFSRVRQLLDKQRHRHLMGEDDVLHSIKAKHEQSKGGLSGSGTSKPRSPTQSTDGAFPDPNSADVDSDLDDLYEPGIDEAQRSKRVQAHHSRRKARALRRMAAQREARHNGGNGVAGDALGDDAELMNADCSKVLEADTLDDQISAALEEEAAAAAEAARVAAETGTTPRRRKSRRGSGVALSGGLALPSTKASSKKSDFPKGEDVALLPPELSQTIMELALDRLREHLYPQLVMMRRRAWKAVQHKIAAKVSTRPDPEGIRRRGTFWSEWPQSVLQQLCRRLEFLDVQPNEFVLYEGEPPGAGVIFLFSGSVRILSRHNRVQSKQLSPTNMHIEEHIHGAACFNEFQFLTEVPRLNAVQATSRSEFWILKRDDYLKLHAMLPLETRNRLREMAFQERVAMVPRAYPMDIQTLRQATPIFAQSSDAMLSKVLPLLKPRAVLERHRFISEGDAIESMLFVRRGRIGAFRDVDGDRVLIARHFGPCVMMDASGLNNQVSPDTLESLTDCDLYSLSIAELDAAIGGNASERQKMFSASQQRYAHALSMQQIKFRPFVFSIPVLRTLVRHDHINALAYLFEAKIYNPLSVVCSTSETCDRIIILIKGKISLGKQGVWTIGESIGFTCILPHRWPCAAVAVEHSECIELPKKFYVAFLQDLGLYEKARACVENLMFPLKGIPEPADVRKRRKDYAYSKGGPLVRNGTNTSGKKMASSEDTVHGTKRSVTVLAPQSTLGTSQFGAQSSLFMSKNESPTRRALLTSGTTNRSRRSSASADSISGDYSMLSPEPSMGQLGSGSVNGPGGSAGRRRQSSAFGGTGADLPLESAITKIRAHVESMTTPPMFPTSESREGWNPSLPGFTTSKTLDDFGIDADVTPGSVAIKALTREQKEQVLADVVRHHRPDDQRRLTHITRFLYVKEKRVDLDRR